MTLIVEGFESIWNEQSRLKWVIASNQLSKSVVVKVMMNILKMLSCKDSHLFG